MFQGLDALSKFAEVVNDKTGGDYSAVEFCNVLKYLRKVRDHKTLRTGGQHIEKAIENKFWQSLYYFQSLFQYAGQNLFSGVALLFKTLITCQICRDAGVPGGRGVQEANAADVPGVQPPGVQPGDVEGVLPGGVEARGAEGEAVGGEGR